MRLSIRSISALTSISLACSGTFATTYYVAPTGNDTNNGTSQTTAWRSIARVQQAANALQPGDQVLFQRGGSYAGQLTMNVSGSAAAPIVLGAYGTGSLPEISGATTVTGWTVHQGNIWRANVAQGIKYVRFNGALMTLARYPNSGWLRVNTASTTQVNSASLTQANGYWNGARMVLRSTNWCYENAEVSSFANSTLAFPAIHYNPGNHQWGFFMCNKLSELDSPGEWYHDATTGVLYFWAPANADPNSGQVLASVHQYGVEMAWQKHHITVQDIAFRNQQNAGVYINSGANMSVTGCTFEWCYYGVRSFGSNGTFTNNTLRHTYATSMTISDDNSTVSNNTIEDIALIPGLGESFWGYYGLHVSGASNEVRNNHISRTGNSGLFLGGSPLVEKNVISDVLLTVNDGGGIYWDSATGATIQDNHISNVGGNLESVAADFTINEQLGHGIYFGNSVIQNIIVRRNTVSNCSSAGIHVDHTMVSSGIQVRDNVLYDNDIQLNITDQSNVNGPGATPPYFMASFNDVYSGNTLYCLTEAQRCVQQYHTHGVNLVDFGTFSNNRYFNPYNELSIRVINSAAASVKFYTLERWQAERNEEAGSTRSPFRQSAQEVTQRTTANLVSNGTFDYNTSGWSGWPNEGQITHQTNVLDNGALKVVYGANSGSPEFYLRTANTINVESGSWYEMKFSLQSNAHGTLRADFKAGSQSGTPYSINSRMIPFDSQRRDLTVIFQSNLSEPALMIFANNFAESTYWMDNVELYKVIVQTIDPHTRHVLLSNPTNAAVDVPLTGCWRDVSGELHSGSITIEAFASTVLAKETGGLCGLTTDVADIEEPMTSRTVFPNPSMAGNPIFISEPVTERSDLEVFDASGRSVVRAGLSAGSTQLPVASDLPSGHYLLLLREGDRVHHHRLVVQ